VKREKKLSKRSESADLSNTDLKLLHSVFSLVVLTGSVCFGEEEDSSALRPFVSPEETVRKRCPLGLCIMSPTE